MSLSHRVDVQRVYSLRRGYVAVSGSCCHILYNLPRGWQVATTTQVNIHLSIDMSADPSEKIDLPT